MNNRILLPVIALSLLSLGVSAEPLRVVVSYNDNVVVSKVRTGVKAASYSSQKAILSKDTRVSEQAIAATICLLTLDKTRTLCVPNPAKRIKKASTKVRSKSRIRRHGGSIERHFETLTVDADNSQQIIETLAATGWYASVEQDYIVSTGKALPRKVELTRASSNTVTAVPNDPFYWSQTYFQAITDQRAGSDFVGAIHRLVDNNTEINVAVFDSVFFSTDELLFTNGYSYVTLNDLVLSPDYLFRGSLLSDSCTAHGTGVAGVIGATTNNEKMIAAAAPGVKLHAIQVMDCGIGFLSDISIALEAMTNDSSYGNQYPGGRIDVINLSMGAETDECPEYLQQAIDKVVAQGTMVVVAAGNESLDSSKVSPANCVGVVNVGAVAADAQFAEFSNYGQGVDIAAQGIDIPSPGTEPDSMYFWEGTSFSTPLVVAAIALVKKVDPKMSNELIIKLMQLTANQINDPDGFCEINGCGSGLLDANVMVALAQEITNGSSGSIRHTLADKTERDQQWYIKYFGEKAPLCRSFEVTFFADITLPASTKFELQRMAKGVAYDADQVTRVLTASDHRILVDDIDAVDFDYYFQLCGGEQCNGPVLSLDTSLALPDLKPAACPKD